MIERFISVTTSLPYLATFGVGVIAGCLASHAWPESLLASSCLIVLALMLAGTLLGVTVDTARASARRRKHAAEQSALDRRHREVMASQKETAKRIRELEDRVSARRV